MGQTITEIKNIRKGKRNECDQSMDKNLAIGIFT
jgi:hypothetical protein